jgi:DNA-binding transcriptional ArsR family regulator
MMLLLEDSPHCVCDIEAHTGYSQSLVSHHLADLMKACLVGSKKDGKYVEYFLTDNGRELLKAVEHVSLCCEVNRRKGGETTMMKGKHGCDCDEEKKECDGGDCCKEESKTEEMSKDDLLAKKSELEESLKGINEALTKTE